MTLDKKPFVTYVVS